MKVNYNLLRFLRLEYQERYLFIKGCFFYILYKLIVKFLPLKYYFPALKAKALPSVNYDLRKIHITKKTLNRIARVLPLKKDECLIKSMLFKKIVEDMNIPCNICLSYEKNESGLLKAHAYNFYYDRFFYLKKKEFVDFIRL